MTRTADVQALIGSIMFEQYETAIGILEEAGVDLSTVSHFEANGGITIEFEYDGKTVFIAPSQVIVR